MKRWIKESDKIEVLKIVMKVSDTMNPKIINQIQKIKIPLKNIIYVNRLNNIFYTGGNKPLGLTA